MNVYQLILKDGTSYFVEASTSDRAIAKIEGRTGQKVSSWNIAQTVPANSNLITR